MKYGKGVDAVRNAVANAINRNTLIWPIARDVHGVQGGAVGIDQGAVRLAAPRRLQGELAFVASLACDVLFAGGLERASTASQVRRADTSPNAVMFVIQMSKSVTKVQSYPNRQRSRLGTGA